MDHETLSVKAEPYKLRMYGEGAMLDPYRDTEEEPGMFATLVVCLPTEHEGGEVHVTHDSKTLVFSTGPTSAVNASYVAW
ncbi:MAG: hypothetical protein M1831_004739 [Alyxoria varia]|nr:MAG: hypothetical protein M1831_004739 [Alyxoria varia]